MGRAVGVGLRERHRTVIVAVAIVGVMKVAIDQVVDVIPMRHGLVTTAGSVDVRRIVAGTHVTAGASIRVGLVDRDHVLVDVVAVKVVEVPVMKVVRVSVVSQGRMPTLGSVDVGVVLMDFAVTHTGRVPYSAFAVDSIRGAFELPRPSRLQLDCEATGSALRL